MTDPRTRWKTERLQASAYDFAVNHRAIAKPLARLLWSYDIDELWRSIAQIPPDATILDVPCGGGLTFKTLRAPKHYVAADLSPTMLARARKNAHRHNATVTLVQADITKLPFPDATFDTCVTYNGLHCLPDPASALRELARVLRPGGVLRGTTLIRGTGKLHDTFLTLGRRTSVFGPTATLADLRTHLLTAGLTTPTLTRSGAVAAFTAVRPE
ncbi:class I SAM-dependent methyltransferase [Spirillospora sp. CA-294931]|uniref:class I SAM-dependent methyltransferase n=1 Tax=Spirillospora sp. CA-294931 TaxID=3240042 RepID=UPI003D8A13AB